MRKDMDKKYRGTRRPGPDFNGKMKKMPVGLAMAGKWVRNKSESV